MEKQYSIKDLMKSGIVSKLELNVNYSKIGDEYNELIKQILDNSVKTADVKVDKKQSGRPKGSSNKKNKYKVTFRNNIYECKTYSDIAKICELSVTSIINIINGKSNNKNLIIENI